MGILISLGPPTRGMTSAQKRAGVYKWPVTGRDYPKAQIITIEELLEGKRLDMPPAFLPYIRAQAAPDLSQFSLIDGS